MATASPAPTPAFTREVLSDFASRIARTPDRVFSSEQLRFTLTMSARLTPDTAAANEAAYEAWSVNRHGSWRTREARERAIREAHEIADLVWSEASADAERAHAVLFAGAGETVTAAVLVERIEGLLAESGAK
ncbi:hypothetical protein ABZ953_06745 [Streptomyces sp. NPDC046465]|uniref:hypothetical protein n=1 Tax=Streptomyces sp. NPDC046465 TaxID=3155810 RepID=UPI0033ECB499